MAYVKHTWVDPKGTNLNRFTKQNESAESVDLIHNPTLTNSPTPFSVEIMNEIEDGIAGADTAATAAKTTADSALAAAQAINPADLTAVRTTAPNAAYSGTGSRLVFLTSEPATKYAGWIYMIAE
jgi:hypothetical protein